MLRVFQNKIDIFFCIKIITHNIIFLLNKSNNFFCLAKQILKKYCSLKGFKHIHPIWCLLYVISKNCYKTVTNIEIKVFLSASRAACLRFLALLLPPHLSTHLLKFVCHPFYQYYVISSLKVYFDHTTYTIRNKWEKLEHIGKAIFGIPFMIQSHAESMKKILGAL